MFKYQSPDVHIEKFMSQICTYRSIYQVMIVFCKESQAISPCRQDDTLGIMAEYCNDVQAPAPTGLSNISVHPPMPPHLILIVDSDYAKEKA